MKKFVATFAIIFLSACSIENATEDVKTMQAYKIYMIGSYSLIDADCSQILLTLGEEQISANEFICHLTGFNSSNNGISLESNNCSSHKFTCNLTSVKSTNDGITLLEGKNCTVAGYKYPDSLFHLNYNEDGTIAYKTSDEKNWQILKKCAVEKK